MDVVAFVVTGGMSIPPVIKPSAFVFFVVVNREISVFEPHYFQTSGLYFLRIESLVVDTHQTLWGKLWLLINPAEAVIGCKSLSNDVESIKIYRSTAKRIGRIFISAVYTAGCRSVASPDSLVSARSRSMTRRRAVFHAESRSQTSSMG